ncbi:MAG: sigma-54 dependent transcriptional regulator [Polyangiaceae bacterium]
MSGRLLVVDDELAVCELLAADLGRHGFEVTTCTSGDAAFALTLDGDFDAVITDLHMRGMSGIDLCERLALNRPDLVVVVITAFGSLETAISAIRAGAYDFVTKPFEMEQIRLTARRAIEHKRLRQEVKRLRERVADPTGWFGPTIIGSSPALARLADAVRRVADSPAAVLVTGESGTGKELVAKAIHDASSRRAGPFVVVNCASLPTTLLESELFGHVKGAFTDARESRQGLFVSATRGTIVLDEIAELPLALQPKLLRVLQSRVVRPLGSDVEIPVDVRIVSATHRDLETYVEEGRFRQDLFYRINVIRLEVPPLRSRGGDVLVLAQAFIEAAARGMRREVRGLSPGAAQKLVAYEWPGNVRELQNCMEHAVALTRFEDIAVEDLPEKIRAYRPNHVVVPGNDPSELVTMEELERRYVGRVLDAVGGNKTAAAKILGFDRATLYRKLERFGRSGGNRTGD